MNVQKTEALMSKPKFSVFTYSLLLGENVCREGEREAECLQSLYLRWGSEGLARTGRLHNPYLYLLYNFYSKANSQLLVFSAKCISMAMLTYPIPMVAGKQCAKQDFEAMLILHAS